MSKETRIDKWLWAMRLYKTRSLAATACRNGQVSIGDQRLKPSRDLHPGEIVTAKIGEIQRTVKVIGFPASRVGAKLVPQYLEDLTPVSEYEKAKEFKSPPPQFSWSKGLGRPTKKSRRLWEKIGGEDEP